MKLKPAKLLSVFILLVSVQHVSFDGLRIKKTTNLKTGSTTEYIYDSDGRISQMQSSNGARTTYSYFTNKIVKQFLDPLTKQNTIDTFFLNDKNRATSVSSNEGVIIQKMSFDGDGHLIQSVNYEKGNFFGKSILRWNENNLMRNTAYDEKGKILSDLNYSYYSNKANTISQINMGMGFTGTDSKNLIEQSIGVASIISSSDTMIPTYKYQFNNDGSVKLKVVYDRVGKLIDSIAYTYY